MSTLWKGNLHTIDHLEEWKTFISKFYGAVAVGSDRSLFVYFTHNQSSPLCVMLPPVGCWKQFAVADTQTSFQLQDTQTSTLLAADKMCVAWALDHRKPSQPLIIFSRGSILYIYNIERKGISGYIRGHGGVRRILDNLPLILLIKNIFL